MSCENCFKGFELPGEPAGSLVDGAYFAPAAPAAPATAASGDAADASAQPPKRAIVLLTDIFGLALQNSKIQADLLAQRVGVDVWVPDLFAGKPPVTAAELDPLLPDRAGVHMGFMSYVRLALLMLPRAFTLYASRPSVGIARAKAFISALRAEKGYERIGAVGYCYGGMVAIDLGTTDLVNSIVIAHPGRYSHATASTIKVPSSWVCAEEDSSFSTADRNKAEALFAAREGKPDFVQYEFKDWKGTAHGFAIRPNQSVPEVKAGYEGALEQTVEWFKKTL